MQAIEFVHELAEYLSRRFPTTFEVARHESEVPALHSGWDGSPPIKTVRILPLAESYDLPLDANEGRDAPTRALEIASLLCVMHMLHGVT